MFEIIFLSVICGYFIHSAIFIIGASKKFPIIDEENLPSVSVIVAARNEDDKILKCIESLDALVFPENKIEIIIIDDQSTDKTGEIVDDFIRGKSKFKKIIAEKEIGRLRGKTNALANAIEIAKNEVILTTDADCIVKPTWAIKTASYYKGDVGMVNGITAQLAFSSFSGMQSLDFIYLLTVAASTINLGNPISCIGNNMSFRKKAYKDAGGYENLPFSVTEDFNLLMAISKLKKYKIIYPVDSDTLVTSLPCSDVKSLYRQKKRWAVGGLGVPYSGFIILANGFLAYLGILLTPFFYSPLCLYLIVLKLFLDVMVFYPVLKNLGLIKNFKYFLHYQLYSTFYVIVLPFTVLFSRKVIWKERKY